MSIKLTGLVLGTAFAAATLTGCQSTTPTNGNTAANRANSNTAVVVNSNGNTAMPVSTTNTNGTNSTNANWNANITRAEWEKDKDQYANRAKEAGSTVGSGVNDAWLWTKTRAALATTDELRDSTINVDVTNDIITLRGTVGSAAQKAKAVAVAKGIEGQKGIKDELKVAANDSVANTGSTTDSTKTNSNTNR